MLFFIIILLIIVLSLTFSFSKKIVIDNNTIFDFWDSLEHYPSWILSNPKYVWPAVKKASKSRNPKNIELILTDASIFTILENVYTNFRSEECKDVELYFNKEIVCAFKVIYISREYDGYDGYYQLSEVDFIKKGSWQERIREFIKWKKQLEIKMKEDMEKRIKANQHDKINKTIR